MISDAHSSYPPRLAHRALVLIQLLAVALSMFALINFNAHLRAPLNLLTWTGVALLTLLVLRLQRRPRAWWERLSTWSHAHGIDFPLLVMAVGLGLLTLFRQRLRLTLVEPYSGSTLLIWILAWTTLLAAIWPQQQGSVLAWLQEHRLELGGVLLATLLAGGLRFYQLGTLPRVINGDEGVIGMWAINIGTMVPQPTLGRHFAAIDGVGTLYLTLMHHLFNLFGASPFTLRLLPAIAGTLAIPATYLLARHMLGRRAAVIATGLLLVSHVHIHFSRTVAVSYIYATLFVPLMLYFFLTGMERRSALRLVLSAVIIGLHLNVYLDGWIWMILLFLLLIAWAIVDRPLFKGNGVNLGLFALALTIMISPFLLWAMAFSADFSSRMTMEGTFGSGWLANEVLITGKSAPQLLFELFQFALATFTDKPFHDFYWADVPTLDALSGRLWMGGVALALFFTWKRRMLVLNGWFWAGVVSTSVMSIPPSTYHYRLLMVLPAACMLVGLAADWLLRLVERAVSPGAAAPKVWHMLMVGMLFVGMAKPNLTTYYDDFLGQCKYGSSAGTRAASLLGAYLRTLPPDSLVYLLTEDPSYGYEYGHHRSTDFLSGGVLVPMNMSAPVTEEINVAMRAELAARGASTLVVLAVPARLSDLLLIQQWFPGGVEEVLTDCDQESLRAYVWKQQ